MNVCVRTNREGFKRVRTMAEALQLSDGDMRGPVLTLFGQLHRKQTKRIFATEGGEGASGKWPALSPAYAKKKRKLFGRKPILVATGEMKGRFVIPTNPSYFQRYFPQSAGRGLFRFGARSGKGAAHRTGLGPLPIRDMLTKTAEQVSEFATALVNWYRTKRVPQVLRHFGPQLRASRPR